MIGLARRHWPSMMLYRHWPFVGVQLFTPPFHTAISHILEYLCVSNLQALPPAFQICV